MSKDTMSKIRAGDVWRSLERILDDRHIQRDCWSVEDVRPHPKLTVTYCGSTRTMSFAGTPSSRFAPKRSEGELRRMLREMEMEAIHAPGGGSAPTRSVVKVIMFRGVEIDTVMHGGEPHVALKPIVEGMGLDWSSQRARVARDAVLEPTMVMTTMVAADGKSREVTTLPLKFLNGFLFGIDENRVKPELRDGVIAYKRECYDALSRYWLHGAAVRPVETDHAHMSDADVARLGGVFKGIIAKQNASLREETFGAIAALSHRIEQIVAAKPLVPSFDFAGTVTSRDMMDMAGIPKAGRVVGTTREITRAMKLFCLERGYVARQTPKDIDPDCRWRFPHDAANEWLFGPTTGADVIRRHIARHAPHIRLAAGTQVSLPL